MLREVARLVRRTGLPAKVNLIAWNPGPGIPYTMPRAEAVEAFRRALADEGVPVICGGREGAIFMRPAGS